MPATRLDHAIRDMAGAPAPAGSLARHEALLKAGVLQSALFNSANLAFIVTDEAGIIQLFSAGAQRMLGYDAADVVNKLTPAHISDPQEVIARAVVASRELGTTITPGFEALVRNAACGVEDVYEFSYVRKDGTRLPVILSVAAMQDEGQKLIGYLFTATDNSSCKDIEERLRWTEESFHLMVESVTDYASVMLDPHGRVVSWNSGAQRINGYSADEIMGQSFTRFYDAQDVERGTPAHDLEAARTRGRFEDEGWRMRRDGSTFWANIVLTAVLDHAGNLRGFAQLTRDLTGRRQAEEEIAQAKAVAEKTTLASAEFLSGMSHELRTSLNAILGFAQLLDSEVPPPTPSQKESVAKILQAGWYLMELINEILDLAMIESGRLAWSLDPMPLAEVMQECRAAIEPQAQKSGIRLTLPKIDADCFIKADRVRVKQVLSSLMSNAVKYNRPGGSVTVECSISAPQRVRISVTDTGAGMQPEQLAQLFRPFSRVGQETSAAAGAGIGLVITKRLVELMGGAIGVRSHVGKGSVFWVELVTASVARLADGDAVRLPLMVPAITDAPPRTLLYVEDNPANLQLVEQIIARRPDMRLLSARNGPLGIALARSSRPDVILMDINLPGMSGIKAMQILRSETLTAHIPVVALSANAIPRDIERGLEAGFFRYLTKPIKVTEFMDTLDVALKHAERDAARVRITP